MLTGMAKPDQNSETITSSDLTVILDPDFPQIIQYTDRSSGAVLYGTEEKLDTVVVNGTEYVPEVSSAVADNSVEYTLTIPKIKVGMDVSLAVDNSVVDFHITEIRERSSTLVKTLNFPVTI